MLKSKVVLFFLVTGSYHGSHVYAPTEGKARALFHAKYNGESIIHMYCVSTCKVLQSYQ